MQEAIDVIFLQPTNNISAKSIFGIPIQNIVGPYFVKVMIVAEYNILIAQDTQKQIFIAPIINNKIDLSQSETINDMQGIKRESLIIVNIKQQILILLEDFRMITLQLADFNIIKYFKLDFLFKNDSYNVIQDTKMENNNFIVYDQQHLQFRRMKNLTLQYKILLLYPTVKNIKLNKYCFSCVKKDNWGLNIFYIHRNLKGKIIRKMEGPLISNVKNLDSILVVPNSFDDTEIINPNSMRLICKLSKMQGRLFEQEIDSILIGERKILVILNRKTIKAYNTNNYMLVGEVQLSSYGTPYKLNYHNSTGIQIFYHLL